MKMVFKIQDKLVKHIEEYALKSTIIYCVASIVMCLFFYFIMIKDSILALQIVSTLFCLMIVGVLWAISLFKTPNVINNMVKEVRIDKEADLVTFITFGYEIMNVKKESKIVEYQLSTLKLRKDRPPLSYTYFDDNPECYFINNTEMFCRIDYFTDELYEVFNL